MTTKNFIKNMAFAITASSLLSLTACDDGLGLMDNKTVKGKGEYQRFTREASGFKGIDLNVSATLHVKQGAAYKVVIDAQQNIADVIETSVENGILEIDTKSGVWNLSYDRLDIYVETPSVNSLETSGAGNILIESALATDDLAIDVSGSGNVSGSENITAKNINVSVGGSGNVSIVGATTGTIEISVSGSGEAKAAGSAETADYSVSGSGNINAKGVVAKAVKAHSSGSGSIACTANESLNASVSGSGDVEYSGNATKVSTSASGSGTVEKKE
jgi:hypothetical protein